MNTVNWLDLICPFDQITQSDPNSWVVGGQPQPILGYIQWRKFEEVIASWLQKTALFDNPSSGSRLYSPKSERVARFLCINAYKGDG